MILQKLITYFSFILLYTTNNTLKDKYIIILKKTLNIPNTLNKTSILSYLFDLYKDLTLYLEENKKLLSRKEKSYINALRNFILQLRRYLKTQSGKELEKELRLKFNGFKENNDLFIGNNKLYSFKNNSVMNIPQNVKELNIINYLPYNLEYMNK